MRRGSTGHRPEPKRRQYILVKLVFDGSCKIIHDELVIQVVLPFEQVLRDGLLKVLFAKQLSACTMRSEITSRFVDEDTLQLGLALDECPELLGELLIPPR
jgi:hypothetical protein